MDMGPWILWSIAQKSHGFLLNESLTVGDLIVDSHWNIPLLDGLFDNHTKENILKIAIGPQQTNVGGLGIDQGRAEWKLSICLTRKTDFSVSFLETTLGSQDPRLIKTAICGECPPGAFLGHISASWFVRFGTSVSIALPTLWAAPLH